MTSPSQDNTTQVQDQQLSNKELNFRNLEAKYQRELQLERAARLEAERNLQERNKPHVQEEDDESEPYVDHKKLTKKLNAFGQNQHSEIQKAMEFAKKTAKDELKQEMWLENNPDFYDVLNHAEKFAQKAPKLAETILRMPEGFERQKLVYENIKQLGLDKPESKASTIQDKIDGNKRGQFYQPSGVGTAPYASQSDYSSNGQKQAYDKMQELKNRLRLG